MKNLIFIFCLLLNITVLYSQELRFEGVVTVDSTKTKKELFNVAKVWLNETYKSGKAVIQMENEENGIILGKATIKYKPSFFVSSIPAEGYIDYTIKLSFKEGRYKYEFYNFIHSGTTNQYGQNGTIGIINAGEKYTGSSKTFNKSYRNKVNEDTQKEINKIIPSAVISLKEYIANPKNSLNDNNDW